MRTRFLAVCLLLIAVMCAVTWYCWPLLPAQVPVHWNAEGVADGYGPRALLWLLGPGMMALATLGGALLPRLAPQHCDISGFESTYYYVCCVTVGLLAYVDALVLAAVLHGGVAMQSAVPAGFFTLLILIGNRMGKLRRNAAMGIRTPWTLASAVVWYATHRLAARLMVGSGLFGLLALWLDAPHWLLLPLMLAWAPLSAGYSLLLYKRLPH